MSNKLNEAEVGMIKTMLTLSPALSQQAILSYFTRPGRDINHARISEIVSDKTWNSTSPAPLADTLAYMQARSSLSYPSASAYARSVPANASLELSYWPVGQGLFTSGELTALAGGSFSWVYDCGSSSSPAILDAAIAKFRSNFPGRRLDLLTLSHFDADHINGIVKLLPGLSVKTLLLPYLPLWQRLLVAIEEGIDANSELFEFFLSPAEYLAERGEIEEIVFVPPTGPDDVADSSEDDPRPDPERPIDGAKIDRDRREDGDDTEKDILSSVQTRTSVLRPNGRITVPGLWEFVPYNDADLSRYATKFFRRLTKHVSAILINRPHKRDKAMKTLKKIYGRFFGNSPERKNLISLFLYSGPVGSASKIAYVRATHPVRWNSSFDNFAQLYTGDGYLDTAARLNALSHFYQRDRRLERAGILQVMHHGAEANWHAGIAANLTPAVSIFSSDPMRKKPGHPSAEVLRDFWPYCPVQVDKSISFRVQATLHIT